MTVCQNILVETPKKTLEEIEKSISKTYHKDLLKPFIKAIQAYQLVEENDRIAVAISGGKDSLLLAKLFQELKKHNKVNFDLVFLSMDPGFVTTNREQLIENCRHLNIPLVVKNSDIFPIIQKIASDHPCYLCARMRRGFLYQQAKLLGCNKLALAHHFDDVIETTLLNMFYGGQFKTMVPKIEAENFEGIELIRPMVYVREKDVIRFIKNAGIQAMNCGCTVTAQKLSSKRREIKTLLETLSKMNPGIEQSIFTAATNINLDAVYGYIQQGVKTDFNQIYQKNKRM